MLTDTIGTLGAKGQQSSSGADAFAQVDLNDFIKLLVTELQHQDPLDPMDNQEILQQISQIREIESNQRLTDTLESVLLGQNVVTASNLIGRSIVALSDKGERVTGEIDRVSIEEGVARLHVGEHTVRLKNVAEILGESGEGAES
jgi:flagellar basal-body rod modification protein FlgD